MEAIGRYIVSISAAAILCGILKSIFPSKGTNAAILRLVTGIFLSLVTIQPLVKIDLTALPVIADDHLAQAQAVSAQGLSLAQDTMGDIIKAQAEAYILDKARKLNADLTVEVILNDENPPVPVSVHLSGKISPSAKGRLETMIQQDLGIPKEDQIWTE